MDITEPTPWVILAFAAMYGIGWATGMLYREGVLREDTAQRRADSRGIGQSQGQSQGGAL